MTDLVENEYGIEYVNIGIRKLRIHRINSRWLVEYQREPQWLFGLDRWWWFNNGTYVLYNDALDRVETLKSQGFLSVAKFQQCKVFEMETTNE